MLLALIDGMTDTFSQFCFKFYGQFKGKDPCYPLIKFFWEYSFFFGWWLKFLLLIWDSKNFSSMAARFFYCILQPAVIRKSIRKSVKCLLFGPWTAQFLHFFFVSIFSNTVISRENFINTICPIQINYVELCLFILSAKGENEINLPSNSSQHSLKILKAETICTQP